MKKLFFSLVLVCACATTVSSQIPKSISYQGFLTNSEGVPLSGYFDMVLALVDNFGTVIWQEEYLGVPVQDGIFRLVLGAWEPIDFAFDAPAQFILSVNGESLEPPVPLTASPYALNSERLGGLFSHEYLRRNAAESTTDSTESPVLRVENIGAGRGMTVISKSAHALYGKSSAGFAAVEGEGAGAGPGVRGSATANHGTIGYTSAPDKGGVFGNAPTGTGVWGTSNTGVGVYGYSATNQGVYGRTIATDEWQPAVLGQSEGASDGVYGWSQSRNGIYGVTQSSNTAHAGVHAVNNGPGPAVYAEGRLYVESGGIFVKAGDLHAEGAFTGNVGAGGAPFPRPAFDSGWIVATRGAVVPLGVSGTLPTSNYNNQNFVVNLMTKGSPADKAGNLAVGSDVHYEIESNNDITVYVASGGEYIHNIRVRVWYYR